MNHMKMKKRTAIAAVTALLVCMAVYLNWSYQQGDVPVSGLQDSIVSDEDRLTGITDPNGGTSDDLPTSGDTLATKISEYFAQLRITRQQARDEAIDVLEETTTDETISVEAKAAAVNSISEISNNALIESRIESLILSKGYRDCAVFLNSESLSIVVAPVDGGMKVEDAIRIKDIAVSETSVKVENIHIMEAQINQ